MVNRQKVPMRRAVVLAAFALASASGRAIGIQDAGLQHAAGAADPLSLDVITYNVFLRGPSQILSDDQERRTPQMPRWLGGRDVVVLQEAFSDRHRDRLIRLLEEEYPYHTRVLGSDRWFAQDGGVIVLSRWPIETQDQRVFDGVCAQVDCWAQKGVIYARIATAESRVHVFATHLQSAYENSDMSEIRIVRRRQLELVRSFVDAQAIPPSEAVIIAGDLNIDSRERDGSEHRALLDILAALELTPYPGPEHEPTWDGATNSLLDADVSQRLDYVLVSTRHRRPLRARSRVLLIRDENGRDLSDHHAIEAHLEFEAQADPPPR